MADTGPVRAFLSYAHEDSEWCTDVLRHIGWLRHSGQIAAFHDRDLKPGERWDDRIKGELTASEIVIALISPNFMDSRYCCLDELQPAIDRHDRGEADLVPIVCDHVDLGPLRPHQCLPQDDKNDLKPLSEWSNRNLPLAKCAAKIRALVEARRPPPAAVAKPTPPLPSAPAVPRVPAKPGLTGRMTAAVAANVGGILQGLLRHTPGGTSATKTIWLPPSAPRVPPAAPPPARVRETEEAVSLGLFLGRQTDLDQLVLWILDEEHDPIAVLGPGGIGKTTLTRAALRDARCAARFPDPDRQRLFVPLDDVRDAAGIEQAIARTLGLSAGERPADVLLSALRTAPTLLVLDNAEMPWEADRNQVEGILAQLAAIPGVSLVASLRGYEPPRGADWRPLIVEPLPDDASEALFLAIAGSSYAADPGVSALLARLDGLPLAIELVAHRAQAEPDATTLLRGWDEEQSAFLRRGRGGRKDLDLAVSIALSLTSPRMTEAGRRLFALLGRLPHGLARADIAAVIPNGGNTGAAALAQSGLVLPDPERLRMLAPVREHAAEHEPGEPEATALIGHYAALADALPFLGETHYDRAAARRARVELPNIESVLPRATARGEASASGWRWVRVGDTRTLLGSISLALAAYDQAKKHFAAISAADPSSVEGQFDLGISNERLGDVLAAQGKLIEAALAYQHKHEIITNLAAAEPGNVERQSDLYVSWNKLGEVRQDQGDLTAALQAYVESKNIADKLHAADPGNAVWQRDLSISWEKLGDVRQGQGDLLGALQAYTESKNIADKLDAAYPGMGHWKRRRFINWKISEMSAMTAATSSEPSRPTPKPRTSETPSPPPTATTQNGSAT